MKVNLIFVVLALWSLQACRPQMNASDALAVDGGEYARKTQTGYVFTKLGSTELEALGLKNAQRLGDVWREPVVPHGTGMLWTGLITDDKGEVRRLSQSDAIAYCKAVDLALHKDGRNPQLEARLPTGWPPSENAKYGGRNSDLVRLREFMGAKEGTEGGYTPQILPNLGTYVRNDLESPYGDEPESGEVNAWIWSSTEASIDSAYAFSGQGGFIDREVKGYSDGYVARCVVAVKD